MAKNFETIAKWAIPNTTVAAVRQDFCTYFDSLQNNNNPPDIFLFIDMDLYIDESSVSGLAQKMNHPSLFAYFSKRQERAEYYESQGQK